MNEDLSNSTEMLSDDELDGMSVRELREHGIVFTAEHGEGTQYVSDLCVRLSDLTGEHPDNIYCEISEEGILWAEHLRYRARPDVKQAAAALARMLVA